MVNQEKLLLKPACAMFQCQGAVRVDGGQPGKTGAVAVSHIFLFFFVGFVGCSSIYSSCKFRLSDIYCVCQSCVFLHTGI